MGRLVERQLLREAEAREGVTVHESRDRGDSVAPERQDIEDLGDVRAALGIPHVTADRGLPHGVGIERYPDGQTTPTPEAIVQRVVALTCGAPPGEATHWTGRAMAKVSGLSLRTVQRIWAAHGLQPHRIRTFKRSTDPEFAAKLAAIVGLYLDPPAHSLVLSLDEKSQIQALDRTQPGLPLKPGKAGTMTHDYKRHGTTTLFAALDVLEGTVISRCMQRHRHQEFLRFLNAVEAAVPAGKVVHVILDNYRTHKHAKVRAWLARHPRFVFHFTPTSCSWLNAVETLFAKLAKRRLQRGVFPSVVALQEAINEFVATHNRNPKPFVWKAAPKAIIAAAKRGYQALDSIH
jgi:hypothetical protein